MKGNTQITLLWESVMTYIMDASSVEIVQEVQPKDVPQTSFIS